MQKTVEEVQGKDVYANVVFFVHVTLSCRPSLVRKCGEEPT